MINNEARAPYHLAGSEEEEAAAAAAAAARYAESMRQQQAAQSAAAAERGKVIEAQFKAADAPTRQAIAAHYELTPAQITALQAPPKAAGRPVLWIGAAAAGALVLFLVLRRRPARSFHR